MAVTKNTHTKVKASKKAVVDENYGTRKGFWLYSALALLALYSLYAVVMGVVSTGHFSIPTNILSLMYAGTSSLLIVVFSLLYFYMIARKVAVSTVAKIAAYILVITAALALLATFVISSPHTTTSDDFYFRFSILFHNPYVSALVNVASIVGSIAAIAKLAQSRKA